MRTPLRQWLCVPCIIASFSMALAVEPQLSFDFNTGAGTSAFGSKANPVELLMLSPSNEPASLYGEAGSGLTGKSGDFALDIGKTTGAMGADGKAGGSGKVRDAVEALGAPLSFTVTGWIRAASKLGGAARIVEYNDPVGVGVLVCAEQGAVSLSVNKKMVSTPFRSENCLNKNVEKQWVFFAVTYDGSKTTENVCFYGGTPAVVPEVITTESLDTGKVPELNRYGILTIGNNGRGIRPFHGRIDNIAIYSSASDGSGALSMEQIKEIYHGDLAAVPSAGAAAGRPLKIALIGDSTVCEYPKDSVLRGWGQMIRELTTSGVLFVNEAEGGKSSRTFPSARWQRILAEKPDFVFIQFGHNDSHAAGRPESTDAASDFPENLRRYINEARGASIVPVLVTPPHRRLFRDGHPTGELAPYAGATKRVAEELKVPLIDLYEQSGKWLDQLGEDGSTSITVNREPDAANDDRTHFTGEGATTLARFVVEAFPKVDARLSKLSKNQ